MTSAHKAIIAKLAQKGYGIKIDNCRADGKWAAQLWRGPRTPDPQGRIRGDWTKVGTAPVFPTLDAALDYILNSELVHDLIK